jgi:hypothetical protein
MKRIQHRLKRTFDIVVSLTLLTLLSPLMALIALAIKLDDGGPVLYARTGWAKTARFSIAISSVRWWWAPRTVEAHFERIQQAERPEVVLTSLSGEGR